MTASSASAAGGVSLADAIRHALALHRAGRLDDAAHVYRAILEAVPAQFDALHMLGVVATQQGRVEEGAALIARAVAARPDAKEALGNLANVLNRLSRFDEAIVACDRAIALDRHVADVWNTRGLASLGLSRNEDALASFDRALATNPRHAVAACNRGNALANLGRLEEADRSYALAVTIEPSFTEAWRNRGNTLRAARRLSDALASFDRAIALSPADAQLHESRADVLRESGAHADAIEGYARALALDGTLAGALEMRAMSLHYLGRNEEAERDFARATELEPARGFALGMLAHLRMSNADWRDRDALLSRMTHVVRESGAGIEPFVFTVHSSSAADQLACARATVRSRVPPAAAPLCAGARYAHDRLRVAYLSADFREHATAYLMSELLERHDRSRFMVSVLSWSTEAPGRASRRIEAACERFVDVRERDDAWIATWMREQEIDIAVDLMGFTHGARPRIFARRPAPVQVNFLGYPGTLGAPYYDYLIADATVIPPGSDADYDERIVRLPGSYQPNDRKRPIASDGPSREACGLPEGAFVFCSFNATYKITPTMFDVWMRLVAAVEGSVLWLLEGTRAGSAHLRREAQARGVDAARLVFAPRAPLEQHLARHRHADLFLDTLPCNAHTTASDALWAGVPVVTCLGSTFAGRVAGSVVRAAGLPELVTGSLAEYEALARSLATHPGELDAITARLAGARATCELFDSERYTRHLEQAFTTMAGRASAGLPAEAFSVL